VEPYRRLTVALEYLDAKVELSTETVVYLEDFSSGLSKAVSRSTNAAMIARIIAACE
jgi:hypothetical protein